MDLNPNKYNQNPPGEYKPIFNQAARVTAFPDIERVIKWTVVFIGYRADYIKVILKRPKGNKVVRNVFKMSREVMLENIDELGLERAVCLSIQVQLYTQKSRYWHLLEMESSEVGE